MERTMISWNLVNWITVILMAVAGYVVITVIAQTFMRWQGGGVSSGGQQYAYAMAGGS